MKLIIVIIVVAMLVILLRWKPNESIFASAAYVLIMGLGLHILVSLLIVKMEERGLTDDFNEKNWSVTEQACEERDIDEWIQLLTVQEENRK